ncbi:MULTISPECIES: SprT-like domain-containing protein [Emticicia]|nr:MULTISPECIES: SprT-like domain-containing protein [Emticicia]
MLRTIKNTIQKVLEPDTPPKILIDEVSQQKMREILTKHLPQPAITYCWDLWREQPFHFKISRTRSTCFGNYIFREGHHKITINNDLNPYAFLVTYIHEIAHQRTWLHKGRRRIAPHGKEWKQHFQQLMAPILNEFVFPENLLVPLRNYMQNPAASSVSYAPLSEALRSFDKEQATGIILTELPDNQWFEFRGNVFQKIEKRRTRILCVEKKSKRRYTILGSARVNPI